MEMIGYPASALGLVLLFMLSKLILLLYQPQNKLNLPPSPPAWPLIGHLHLLGTLVHQSLAQIACNYGPLVFLRLGTVPTVVVSNEALAREFLKTYDQIFDHVQGCWPQIYFFTIKRTWHGHNTDHTGEKSERSVWNYFASNSKEALEFKEIGTEYSHLLGVINFGDFIPYVGLLDIRGYKRRLMAARKRMDSIIDKIIQEHQEKTTGVSTDASIDFVDVLLSLKNNKDYQHLSMDSIKALVIVSSK
ncbi:hypothetical protein O6H91_Y272200 [Diphasiastrum complanatum]|nr:hypothetical protein O6H91_Y272200 [Diphasiastrum complanatum]